MKIFKDLGRKMSANMAANKAHRREMELKHGWPPPERNTYHDSNGFGIAVAGSALALAIMVVGLAAAIGMASPQEWVAAYLELQEVLATRDLLTAR